MKFKQKTDEYFIMTGEYSYKKAPELKIDQVYYTYDDGKIDFSRMSKFKIVEAINLDKDFNKLDKEWREAIKKEIEECYWLFNEEQTIIYRGIDLNEPEDTYGRLFLATRNGGWFSTGWMGGGRLDYDNHLTIDMLENCKKEIAEYGKYIKEDIKETFGMSDIDKIIELLKQKGGTIL